MMEISPNVPIGKPCLKMIIVDDEPLIRQGLRCFFDWKEYHICEIFEAENGSEALEICENERPDIILSDIRMPDINGLEFIKKAKQILPDAVVIIISGYDDFNYAQQAISLGVMHYLVKPVNTEELRNVMGKCVESIFQQKNRKNAEKELCNKLEKAMPVIRDNLMMNILTGGIDESEEGFRKMLNDSGVEITGENYKVIVISDGGVADESFNVKNLFPVLMKDLFEEYIDEIAKEFSKEFHKQKKIIKYYALMDVRYLKVVVSWGENVEIATVIEHILQRIVQRVKTLYSIELFCSSGPRVKAISDICISAKEAASIMDYKTMMKQPGIWFFEDVKGTEARTPFIFSRRDLEKLMACIEHNEVEGIKRILIELKSAVNENKYISVEYIYSIFLEIIVSANRFAYESGMNNIFLDPTILEYNNFLKFKTLDEVFVWIENHILNLMRSFNKFLMARPRNVIEMVISYIKENIHTEISLSKVSEQFFYNPSYLSRLFKKETDSNFLDYVNKCKIEKAVELLNESDLTAYEVCKRIGYSDYKYFISVFKKYTGTLPSDIRSQRSHNS